MLPGKRERAAAWWLNKVIVAKMAAMVMAVAMLAAAPAAAAQVTLVNDGQAQASIVVKPRPADFPAAPPRHRDELIAYRQVTDEQAAAEDLVRVVERMTGAKLAIADAPQQGLTPIYIGDAAQAVLPDIEKRLAHPDPLSLVNDRYLVHVSPDHVALVGARGWATRLAVTQMLEAVGCRWYGAGAFFEVIPQNSTLTIETGETPITPDFEMRNIWYVPDDDRAHLKMTRHDEVLSHGHAWHNWIGKERDENPQLRGLVHGERVGPLEYTHPDVPEIFIRNINKYIGETGQRTVSMSTDDGPVYSQSKESAQWLLTEWSNPFMATPSISDALMRLYNRIIPGVLEEHPDTVFGFLVYANTMTPPRYESVHPALAIVGAPLAENPMVPTPGTDDPRRVHFRESFETWMKLATRGYIYEYDPLVIWHGVITPRVELIRRNVPYYASIGVRGMNIESRQSIMGEIGPNVLVYSRLFIDNHADVDAILDEYCQTFYGDAAAPMRKYLDITQKNIIEAEPPLFGNEAHNIELVHTRQRMADANAALKEAESIAKDEPYRTRVHAMRLMFDQTMHYLDAKDAIDASRFARAVDAIDAMYESKAALHAIDAQLADPNRWDSKVEGPPWLRGVRKQVRVWAALIGEGEAASDAPPAENDADAQANAQYVNQGTLIERLPETWRFAFDPDNLGMTNDWAQMETLPGETKIDIGQPWDYQGYDQPRTANGWYRTSIRVSDEFDGKPVRLFFTRVYGMKMDVFLDGKLIEHRDLPRYFWFDYNHDREFDLTPHITHGQSQTLTVRIFKEFDWGGTYGGVFLYSPTDPKRPLVGLPKE